MSDEKLERELDKINNEYYELKKRVDMANADSKLLLSNSKVIHLITTLETISNPKFSRVASSLAKESLVRFYDDKKV